MAERQIDGRTQDEATVIYAYEFTRAMLRQDCSRYPRLHQVSWEYMDTEAIRREGLFYSALAGFIFFVYRTRRYVFADNVEDTVQLGTGGSEEARQTARLRRTTRTQYKPYGAYGHSLGRSCRPSATSTMSACA